VVVLAVIAVIGVVIAVIAGAVAVLPRQNRFGVGAQTSYSASATPAAASATPTQAATTAPKPDLPNPVLAAAAPRVIPSKAAVANKIRAVKVKGVT
jgi:hypothetical protein